MKQLIFKPYSFIRTVDRENLTLSGSLTLDVINDYTDLPLELEKLYHFLSDFGEFEEAELCTEEK